MKNEQYLKDGMERLLNYKEDLLSDPELIKMCSSCEAWYGKEHDYENCKECQAFKFYCELEEYRFVDTF